MKLLKKNIIFILILLIIPIYYFGLYQKEEFRVGTISLLKPFVSRFYVVSVENNVSFLESVKNYLGLKTSFDLDNLVILNFKNIFTGKNLHVSFRTSENEKSLFMRGYNLNSDLYQTGNNCTFLFQELIENDRLYEISGLFHKTHTTFYILGNDKLDVMKMQKHLCNQSIKINSSPTSFVGDAY